MRRQILVKMILERQVSIVLRWDYDRSGAAWGQVGAVLSVAACRSPLESSPSLVIEGCGGYDNNEGCTGGQPGHERR